VVGTPEQGSEEGSAVIPCRRLPSPAILRRPGALSIAALESLGPSLAGKKVVCVVSGSNNDVDRLAEIKERSLVYEGLKHYFLLRFAQRPGERRSDGCGRRGFVVRRDIDCLSSHLTSPLLQARSASSSTASWARGTTSRASSTSSATTGCASVMRLRLLRLPLHSGVQPHARAFPSWDATGTPCVVAATASVRAPSSTPGARRAPQETGPALVGIELSDRADYAGLLARLRERGIDYTEVRAHCDATVRDYGGALPCFGVIVSRAFRCALPFEPPQVNKDDTLFGYLI
jgi:hypothetical protein